MNRWLKYGGIMPEWISSAKFNFLDGSAYNNTGTISQNDGYKRTTNYVFMKAGRYKISFNVNSASSATGSRLRILKYNMENEFVSPVINTITYPMTTVNTVLSYYFELTEDCKIRMSYRIILDLLGIEKL